MNCFFLQKAETHLWPAAYFKNIKNLLDVFVFVPMDVRAAGRPPSNQYSIYSITAVTE